MFENHCSKPIKATSFFFASNSLCQLPWKVSMMVWPNSKSWVEKGNLLGSSRKDFPPWELKNSTEKRSFATSSLVSRFGCFSMKMWCLGLLQPSFNTLMTHWSCQNWKYQRRLSPLGRYWALVRPALRFPVEQTISNFTSLSHLWPGLESIPNFSS